MYGYGKYTIIIIIIIIKTQWEKIKTQGEKISYIFPQLKYADKVLSQKKICVQREKYDLISLLQYFPPSAPSVKVQQLLRGKN